MTGQVTKNGIYIIERDFSNKHEACWRCICPVCKKENWIVKGSRLRGTNQVSMCKRCTSLNNLSKIQEPYFKDITNQRFGKLIALRKLEQKNKTTYLWECQCDCGNICIKDGEYLRNGDTQSCGCDSSSHGELKIQQILSDNNIEYTKEKTFEDFIYSDTLRKPRFDFFIKHNQKEYLVEYDGIQHFKQTFYSNDLTKIKNNDKIKNDWCKQNNIPLIRIPYTHLKELCLEDLLLETSKFIVGGEYE